MGLRDLFRKFTHRSDVMTCSRTTENARKSTHHVESDHHTHEHRNHTNNSSTCVDMLVSM
jgi:hypothetical protein